MKIMLVLAGFVLMIACFVISTSDMAQAEEVLGVGTAALIGGDLTDPEDDGAPDSDEGYNAIFSANEEPGFGAGNLRLTSLITSLAAAMPNGAADLGAAFRKKVYT